MFLKHISNILMQFATVGEKTMILSLHTGSFSSNCQAIQLDEKTLQSHRY
jgi:hypothetical protein